MAHNPKKCFDSKVKAGIITQKSADKLREELASYGLDLFDNGQPLSPTQITQYKDAIEKLQAIHKRKKYVAALSVLKQAEVIKNMEAHPHGELHGVLSMITRDRTEARNDINNVEYASKTIRDTVYSNMGKFFERYAPNLFNLKGKNRNDFSVLRALFNEKTGDKVADEIANGLKLASESLRKQFNQVGGNIAYRENWHLPTAHDRTKVAASNADEWTEFMMKNELLDRASMTDDLGRELNDEELVLLLKEVYETISTDGMNKLINKKTPNNKFKNQLSERHSDKRILQFKNSDAWIAYHAKYGQDTSVYDIWLNHIETMAQDIAMLDVFGPNLDYTKQFITQRFDIKSKTQSAKENTVGSVEKTENRIKSNKQEFLNNWDYMTGESGVPVNNSVARKMSGFRQWLMASQLGGAILSSLSDPAMMAMTAKFNGLPAWQSLGKFLKNFVDTKSELDAIASGYIADSFIHAGSSAFRFTGEMVTAKIPSVVLEGTMRASLLRKWTEAGKIAFQQSMTHEWAKQSGKSFNELSEAFQDTFIRYGIDSDKWDIFRTLKPHEPEAGVKFLRPIDALRSDDIELKKIGAVFNRMMLEERDLAVYTNSHQFNAAKVGLGKAGTLGGEIARMGLMYKSFPIGTFMNLINRTMAVARRKGGWAAARYASSVVIVLTAAGYLSQNAKNLKNGKGLMLPNGDFDHDFNLMKRSMLQGGGLGIFGDFLLGEQNRFGNNFLTTLAGPGVGFVNDAAIYLHASASNIKNGDYGKFGRESVQFIYRNTPGHSLWYAQKTLDDFVNDILIELDPAYEKTLRRRQKRTEKNEGITYWSPLVDDDD